MSLTTGDADGAFLSGTEVGLVLCGDKGESQLHPVTTDAQFKPGGVSKFEVNYTF